jgi:hypothetical protein
MPKDQYKSIDVLHFDDNDNLYVSFPNKEQICIPSTKFTTQEIENIKNDSFCPGCTSLSVKGYNGTKRSWCKLSRLIANYTN